MTIKYTVNQTAPLYANPRLYKVIKTTTIEGERLDAYESAPDKTKVENVFEGTLPECDSFIRLTEGGYLK